MNRIALPRSEATSLALHQTAVVVERRVLHWQRTARLALLVLAFGVRVLDLGGRELWFDEALTAKVIGLGWGGILDYLRSAPFEHPPLYFLSLYPWSMVAGTSEFALRFYSVFWGVLLVVLLYAFVRRASSEPVALLTTAVVTLSPFLVTYAQEARMYSMLPAVAIITLLVFCRALEEERARWWLAYLGLLAVGLTIHYFFAFVWLACVVYLAIEYARGRRVWVWSLGIHAVGLIGVAAWVIASSGMRESLVRVWQGEMSFGLAYKLSKIMPVLMLHEIDGSQVSLPSILVVVAGWVLVLIGAWSWRKRPPFTPDAWRLLLVFLVVPLVAAILVPYGVLGRHLGFLLLPIAVLMALGLLALRRKGRFWPVPGLAAIVLIGGYGLPAHYGTSNGDIGQALDYIDRHALPGDVIVHTQPAQEPMIRYYNHADWPVRYVPAEPGALDAARVEAALTPLKRRTGRVWLGPSGAWTADPERLVEQWFVANGYQAEKVWFPDSSSVTLFILNDTGLEPVDNGPWTWGGLIRLESFAASHLRVAPGDSILLNTAWRPGFDLEERYELSISLVDQAGMVWVEQASEPCAGWCATDSWRAGEIQRDRRAIVIPPGTPPGSYEIRVGWQAVDDGGQLHGEIEGQSLKSVPLAGVRVERAAPGAGLGAAPVPQSLPYPMPITFDGEVALLGYDLSTRSPQAGETLYMETHWNAIAAPAAEYALLLEMVAKDGAEVGQWRLVPFTGQSGTDEWQPGQYLRGQHLLGLPADLAAGRYHFQVSLVAPNGRRLLASRNGQVTDTPVRMGTIDLLDRPRSFALPDIEHQVGSTVGRNAQLVGYDLDTSAARAGGQLRLVLYWRARDSLARPFKVFTHLVDDDERPLAQHDAPPGDGCCPTHTWVEGEVVIDEHILPLPADLAAGSYHLVAGMYDEATNSRLPVYDRAGNQLLFDRVPITDVHIDEAPTIGEPLFEFDYRIYIPLLTLAP